MKLALKLLIVTAVLVAVAGLCGGWKWSSKSASVTRAAAYTLAAADPNGPASSTSTDTSFTLAPTDPNGSASITPADTTLTAAPADPNGSASITPADTSFTPDGWTWD
jgi:hypothetical protein